MERDGTHFSSRPASLQPIGLMLVQLSSAQQWTSRAKPKMSCHMQIVNTAAIFNLIYLLTPLEI